MTNKERSAEALSRSRREPHWQCQDRSPQSARTERSPDAHLSGLKKTPRRGALASTNAKCVDVLHSIAFRLSSCETQSWARSPNERGLSSVQMDAGFSDDFLPALIIKADSFGEFLHGAVYRHDA